jgi:hypothetical protein
LENFSAARHGVPAGSQLIVEARFGRYHGRMCLGIYPVFEPAIRDAKFNALGEILVVNLETLDDIAAAARLKPLASFGDAREIPADFDGSPDELDDLLGPWTEWFDAEDGRAAIQALVDYIKKTRKAAQQLDDPPAVVEELEELVRVLAIAARQGVKFRLEMS